MKIPVILVLSFAFVSSYKPNERIVEIESRRYEDWPTSEQNRYYRNYKTPDPYTFLRPPSISEEYRDHAPSYRERPPYFRGPPTSYRNSIQGYYNNELPFRYRKLKEHRYMDSPPLFDELDATDFPERPFEFIDQNHYLKNQGLPGDSKPVPFRQQRQPLSFGGHSSPHSYGNHALGFASVPLRNSSVMNFAAISTSTISPPMFESNLASQPLLPELDKWKLQTPERMNVNTNMKVNTLTDLESEFSMSSTTTSSKIETSTEQPFSNNAVPLMNPLSNNPWPLCENARGLTQGPNANHNFLLEESKRDGLNPSFQHPGPSDSLTYIKINPNVPASVKYTLPVPAMPLANSMKITNEPQSLNTGTSDLQQSASSDPLRVRYLPPHNSGYNQVPIGRFAQSNQELLSETRIPFSFWQSPPLHAASSTGLSEGSPLQLGGFGGIDYHGASSNLELRPAVFGFSKASLNIDPYHTPQSDFQKIGFGQHLWQPSFGRTY